MKKNAKYIVLNYQSTVKALFINTRGFDLPQTGSYGNWMFPVIGLSVFALSMAGIYLIFRKKKAASK